MWKAFTKLYIRMIIWINLYVIYITVKFANRHKEKYFITKLVSKMLKKNNPKNECDGVSIFQISDIVKSFVCH